MKKVFVWLIFVVLIGLVGCSEDLFDSLNNPGKSVTTLDTANGSTQVLASGSLNASNTTDFIEVDVRPNRLSRALVYFELLGANLKLTFYNDDREPVRESDGPDFFRRINSSSLSSEAISVNKICRGPCVISETDVLIRENIDTIFLKVEARVAGASVDYQLYSYSDPYQDQQEPANNDCGVLDNTAIIPIPIDQDFEGALEAIEDIDCYESNGSISRIALQLNVNTTIDVKAEIFNLNGSPILPPEANPLRARAGNTGLQILTIDPPQAVIVKVTTDNNRAAPAGNSKYILSFETP